MDTLTEKERHVIDLIAVFGLSDRQLALAVGTTYYMVKQHVRHIMDKLGVDTRLEIAKWRLLR